MTPYSEKMYTQIPGNRDFALLKTRALKNAFINEVVKTTWINYYTILPGIMISFAENKVARL